MVLALGLIVLEPPAIEFFRTRVELLILSLLTFLGRDAGVVAI